MTSLTMLTDVISAIFDKVIWFLVLLSLTLFFCIAGAGGTSFWTCICRLVQGDIDQVSTDLGLCPNRRKGKGVCVFIAGIHCGKSQDLGKGMGFYWTSTEDHSDPNCFVGDNGEPFKTYDEADKVSLLLDGLPREALTRWMYRLRRRRRASSGSCWATARYLLSLIIS